mmetsp:Transcript_4659/g.5271  ORF Transcript_4659/g.5271 Transcript_4659/m.5271 type:complete len:366 (+) Transcript_4659:38-1135(+)|eukprot:CAMPEP_0115009044 /NCGR_PEP_ID=MMETSP0216-20121206/22345_1 /TAXON_ID=223996 /ORGANISM="Protocruzia adherens, Strain Boccale" /LENGTH=365 /DNA_ID=CAMNT_0002376711 /DNA_START=38 /DNA_END=1135 /DNA_ORIENTATION=-
MVENQLRMGDTYQENSGIQKSATVTVVRSGILADRIARYIEENQEEFHSGSSFRVAEYGCADGSNSVDILEQIIQTVRKHDEDKKIEIMCNDLPTSNFSKLFNLLNPLREKYGNIYLSVSGCSFYNQVAPSESFDLVYSFTSVQWMSSAPCPLSKRWYIAGQEDLDQKSREIWSEYAIQEWTKFLSQREKELKKGGILYVSTICFQDPPTEGNKLMTQAYNIFAQKHMQVLKEYGVSEDYPLNLPAAFRSKDEFLQPFSTSNLKLKLEEFNRYRTEVPVVLKLARDGERAKLQKMLEDIDRAFSQPFYSSQLQKIPTLTEERREELLEKLYSVMFADLPSDYDYAKGFGSFYFGGMMISKNGNAV